MSNIHVQTEKVIPARPQEVYTFLANYREKRPQILTDNFQNYTVETGGKGAGTTYSYLLRAARRERTYHMSVTEPVKGKVLQESDTGSSLVTIWTLEPAANNQTRVQVVTEWQGGSGVGGFFEKTFAPMGLKRIYDEMLDKLATTFSGTTATAS
jgi:hypothetical protein